LCRPPSQGIREGKGGQREKGNGVRGQGGRQKRAGTHPTEGRSRPLPVERELPRATRRDWAKTGGAGEETDAPYKGESEGAEPISINWIKLNSLTEPPS